MAGVAATAWLHRGPSRQWPDAVALDLERAASALGDGDAAASIGALRGAIAVCGDQTDIGRILASLADAITRHWQDGEGSDAGDDHAAYPLILHRDWTGARQAFLRAVVAIGLAGALWIGTGWQSGPFLLLGLSIFVSLFSTFENPAAILRLVVVGQATGILGALVCRWLVWPFATTDLQLILMVVPFILFGAFFAAYRRTVAMGFDYNMVMLLLLKPALPLAGTFTGALATGVAVLAGPVAALVAFRLVFPLDAARRRKGLALTMVAELNRIAADPEAGSHRMLWRARFYYRLLRLVRLQERTGGGLQAVIGGGLAVLTVGNALFDLHQCLAGRDANGPAGRALRVALRRAGALDTSPENAARAFDRAARYLAANAPGPAHTLRRAARDIQENAGFFRQAA